MPFPTLETIHFSAFALAHAIFEIPTAWWADRAGARHALTRIVVWWSGFTMATAGAFNYSSLLVTQFLFGAGEAGAVSWLFFDPHRPIFE